MLGTNTSKMYTSTKHRYGNGTTLAMYQGYALRLNSGYLIPLKKHITGNGSQFVNITKLRVMNNFAMK
jgi:hypothetical protein